MRCSAARCTLCADDRKQAAFFAWRLSKEQIKWLNNKAHDKRPEIRKLAQEQLDMRFHPERLASDDADEFEDLLLNKDDEDEDEW